MILIKQDKDVQSWKKIKHAWKSKLSVFTASGAEAMHSNLQTSDITVRQEPIRNLENPPRNGGPCVAART